MGAFIVRRLLGAIVVVFVVVLLVFFLVNWVGDPAVATLGPNAGPSQIQDFKRKHGLDRSLMEQFVSYLGVGGCARGRRAAGVEDELTARLSNGREVHRPHRVDDEHPGGTPPEVGGVLSPDEGRWRLDATLTQGGRTQSFTGSGNLDTLADAVAGDLRTALGDAPVVVVNRINRGDRCGLLQGDLGESFGHNEPVAEVIAHRLPRTLLLGAVAMSIELLIGLGVGIFAALRRNTWVDTGFMSAAYLGISMPTFVTGPIFLAVFGFYYGWFPLGGYGSGFWDHVYHALLPGFTLAIIGAATYARVMRSELVDTLRSDYIRTAAAKGLPGRGVVRHAVRNALLPIATMVGLSLTLLVAGAIITETIFGWPGMGNLAIRSIVNLDAPTVMGVVLVFAVTVQVGNLLADIAVAFLDPRVRLEKSG
ncbi:MAG: ABC transporter permease [Myxococcota bacterium]